jgi:hypothetical protein
MMLRSIAGMGVFCLAAAIALPAAAQNVTLVCARGASEAPEVTLDIDYGRAVVNFPYANIPIRVQERSIDWQVPRRRDAGGAVFAAGFFRLDRVTGEFRRDHDCNDCPTAPPLYCKPGKKLF